VHLYWLSILGGLSPIIGGLSPPSLLNQDLTFSIDEVITGLISSP